MNATTSPSGITAITRGTAEHGVLGARATKTVIAGYASGKVEVEVVYEITNINAMGNGPVWACGVIVETTDAVAFPFGRLFWVAPVDEVVALLADGTEGDA